MKKRLLFFLITLFMLNTAFVVRAASEVFLSGAVVPEEELMECFLGQKKELSHLRAAAPFSSSQFHLDGCRNYHAGFRYGAFHG